MKKHSGYIALCIITATSGQYAAAPVLNWFSVFLGILKQNVQTRLQQYKTPLFIAGATCTATTIAAYYGGTASTTASAIAAHPILTRTSLLVCLTLGGTVAWHTNQRITRTPLNKPVPHMTYVTSGASGLLSGLAIGGFIAQQTS